MRVENRIIRHISLDEMCKILCKHFGVEEGWYVHQMSAFDNAHNPNDQIAIFAVQQTESKAVD